jgi:arginase
MRRDVRIIGAPTDYGTNRRGVDMGPSAIRYAGLQAALSATDRNVADAGDLAAPRVEERESADDAADHPNAKYLPEVRDVTGRLASTVSETLADGSFPLVLGGDHSVAIGTLRGASDAERVGVVWFDAHADINTPETTPSGNVHGMPLAAALGLGSFADMAWTNAPGVHAENVVLVGLRSVDPGERETIADSDVTAFTMSDIDERGVADVLESALDAATAGADALHVSFDLDWLDPVDAPGVGTPVRGGVTYREAHTALEAVAERNRDDGVLRSMELVEVNPILDRSNETAELAAELAASALGKRIL